MAPFFSHGGRSVSFFHKNLPLSATPAFATPRCSRLSPRGAVFLRTGDRSAFPCFRLVAYSIHLPTHALCASLGDDPILTSPFLEDDAMGFFPAISPGGSPCFFLSEDIVSFFHLKIFVSSFRHRRTPLACLKPPFKNQSVEPPQELGRVPPPPLLRNTINLDFFPLR